MLLASEHVHHLDENRSNNNIDNLKIVSPKEHHKYHGDSRRQIKYGNAASKYLGVSKRKNRPTPWFAGLKVNGVQYLTKCFKTEKEAALAYDKLVKKHLPEGKLNFPDTGDELGDEGEEE